MGRKIKSSILLALVLVLIYMQQSVIYAQNDTVSVPAAEDSSDKNSEVQSPEGENSGEENSGEGDKEEQPEKPESPEKPEGPEKPESPEKPEISRYTLEFSKADGKNEYYITKPNVTLIHRGKYGATMYELKNEEEILAQGRLEFTPEEREQEEREQEEAGWEKKIQIGAEMFREGRNILHIYMEDEEGNLIPEYEETCIFLVDTQKPDITVSAPEGFQAWYQKEAWIQVEAEDSCSQIEQVVCYAGNQMIGKTKEKKAEFLIHKTSENGDGVSVTVTVTDQAGNKTEKTVNLYIDNLAPKVDMAGATDYLITSRPVTLEYRTEDENALESSRAVIDYENPEKENTQEMFDIEDGWILNKNSAKLCRTFEEDGIYKTTVQAVDKAKQKTEKTIQFIIDTQNPVIKMVDELQGKYLKKFSWDYPASIFIKDFTTFVHQVQMDGRLYPIGTEIHTEGRHTLQVNATDAAGNQAIAKAEFIIDHTPPEIRFYQLEDGAVYEGIADFQIDLEKKEDKIKEITINGKSQSLKKENGKYPFQITDPGEYEVQVTATDLAGNVAEKNLSFEVVPEKTILEKAAEPLKKILSVDEKKPTEAPQVQNKNRHFAILKWIVTGSIISILLVICGAIIYRRKNSNKKGEE